jgi:hypothetical protein
VPRNKEPAKTESSSNKAEDPEKETNATSEKPTKPELEEKAEKNKYGDG